jgi:hypothetical protein
MARNELVMEAARLSLLVLVPCRQVTGWTWPVAAIASWRKVTGDLG